jgi:hypothetical protein
MIVDSTLKCVQTYHTSVMDVHIAPGRNLIRDDAGRELMQNRFFLDMLNTKALGFQKQVQVTIPPGPDPKLAAAVPGGKSPVTPPDGETAVTNMKVGEAVEVINQCSLVEQLQDIMLRDPRAGVKKACEARIAVLAAEAQSGKPAADDDDDLGDDESAGDA